MPNMHYCRMLLTRHYDQRPFDETMCDVIIANGGVKNLQKRCKTFAMTDANTVQILVARAMQGIRFTSINCLRWGGTKETVSQIKVCAIYGMWFTRMNYLRWDKRTEMVQLNKMCVIRGKQVCNRKCVGRPITTQMIPVNKPCVLWANDFWCTIVSDWWNHHRWVALFSLCAMWFALSTEHQHIYLKRQHCINKLSIQLHEWLHI